MATLCNYQEKHHIGDETPSQKKVEEYNAGLIEMEVVTATLKSYLGMLDHCDCKEFRKELIDSVVLDRNKVIGEIAYEVENYSEAMVCGL